MIKCGMKFKKIVDDMKLTPVINSGGLTEGDGQYLAEWVDRFNLSNPDL